MTLPVTPRIVTPLLILASVILLSIAEVTALTVIGLYPSVPDGAVIICCEVVGVTERDSIAGVTDTLTVPKPV